MTDPTPALSDEQFADLAVAAREVTVGPFGPNARGTIDNGGTVHLTPSEALDFAYALGPVVARMVADAEARAKAEAWDEGYEVGYDDAIFEQRGLPTDSDAHEFPHANPYRADSLAAQPAPEEGCSSCGLYGGGHAHPDCEGAQPAPEAATVEEVRPSDVRKVVSEALDDVANNLMPRPTSDERIAIRVLAAFDVRRKP